MGGILDMGKIEMTDEYVRVGTTLYKIVFQPLINGTFAKRRVPWSMGTLRYDHGKDFIASVPKYDGFCTVPSHVDLRGILARSLICMRCTICQKSITQTFQQHCPKSSTTT